MSRYIVASETTLRYAIYEAVQGAVQRMRSFNRTLTASDLQVAARNAIRRLRKAEKRRGNGKRGSHERT